MLQCSHNQQNQSGLPTMTNKPTLSFDDQLAQLLTEVKNMPKKKPGRKASKGKEVDPASLKYDLSKLDKYHDIHWRETHCVLLLTHVTCQCCQTTWDVTNPEILIRRVHPKYGVHFTTITHDQTLTSSLFGTLPRYIEHHHEKIACCETCFQNGNFITDNIPQEKSNAESQVSNPHTLQAVPLAGDDTRSGGIITYRPADGEGQVRCA